MGAGQRRSRGARRHNRQHRHHHQNHHAGLIGLRPYHNGGYFARPLTPARFRVQLVSSIIIILFGILTCTAYLWFFDIGFSFIALIGCIFIGGLMIFVGIFNLVRVCKIRQQLAQGGPQGEQGYGASVGTSSQVQVGQQATSAVWATGQSGATVLPQQYGPGGQLGYPFGLQTHPGQLGYPTGLQPNTGQTGYPPGLQTNAGETGNPTEQQTTTGQTCYPPGQQTAIQPRFFQVQPSSSPTDQGHLHAPNSNDPPPPTYDEAVQIGASPANK